MQRSASAAVAQDRTSPRRLQADVFSLAGRSRSAEAPAVDVQMPVHPAVRSQLLHLSFPTPALMRGSRFRSRLLRHGTPQRSSCNKGRQPALAANALKERDRLGLGTKGHFASGRPLKR